MTTSYVRSIGHTAQATIVRPNNTTAYAAGQTVGSAALVFSFSKEGSGFGTLRQVLVASSANQATKPDLELWLFDTQPVATIVDGTAFVPTNADIAALVAVVAIPVASFKVGNAGAAAAGNVACDVQGLVIPINTVKMNTTIWGVLVVRNAYAPVSNEVIQIRLKVRD